MFAKSYKKIPKDILTEISNGQSNMHMLHLKNVHNNFIESYNLSSVASSASGLKKYKGCDSGPSDGSIDGYVYKLAELLDDGFIDKDKFKAIMLEVIDNIKKTDTIETLLKVNIYDFPSTIDLLNNK